MKRSVLAALAVGMFIAVVVALPRASSASGGGKGSGDSLPRPTSSAGLNHVRQLAASVGAPRPWQDFFVLVAQGESKGYSDVGLGTKINAPPWVEMHSSSSEAKAAADAYEHNRAMFAGCWSPAAYGFGSGGLFGMLPANALAAFESTPLMCLHPWTVFDAKISMIMAAWFARRLTSWSNWQGTVLSLRRGWGNPSKMDTPEDRRSEYEEDCRAAGLPESFLDEKLERWKPAAADELFERLGGDHGWLPGGRS